MTAKAPAWREATMEPGGATRGATWPLRVQRPRAGGGRRANAPAWREATMEPGVATRVATWPLRVQRPRSERERQWGSLKLGSCSTENTCTVRSNVAMMIWLRPVLSTSATLTTHTLGGD